MYAQTTSLPNPAPDGEFTSCADEDWESLFSDLEEARRAIDKAEAFLSPDELEEITALDLPVPPWHASLEEAGCES